MPAGAIFCRAVSIQAGISRPMAACNPAKSPMLHCGPSHLCHSRNIGPTPCRMDGPTVGSVCEANSGASS